MPKTAAHLSRSNYWQQQIRDWQVSGLSQKAFCQANDLNYPRFGYRVRKLRKASDVPEARHPKSAFVPVALKPSSEISGLHLVLPGGLEIRGITPDNLSLVQQLLGTLS